MTFEVFSLGGSLLYTNEIPDYYEYDITGYATGSYLLRLSSGSKTWHGWFFRF